MKQSNAKSNPPPIEITVNDLGNIGYNQATYHGKRGRPIRWICAQGPFSIQFKGASPFDVADARTGAEAPYEISLDVLPQAPARVYSYSVSVCVNGQVFIDASCPVIIIDFP